MFQKFYPNAYLDSTYEIDFEKLKKDGFAGVIFDIDNTLVMHGEPADARALALFQRLFFLGFDTCQIIRGLVWRVLQIRYPPNLFLRLTSLP